YSTIQMDGYRTLKAGQQVSYEIEKGPKGCHASSVVPLEGQAK
ncbi:cold shock domain-containing protein, partial [Vibrio sp. 1942]